MKTLVCSCALALAGTLGSVQDVAAATIDFEGYAPEGGATNVNPDSPYIEDGFTLVGTNSNSAVFDSDIRPTENMPSTPTMPGNETDWFGFAMDFAMDNALVLSATSGGVFDLLALDAGAISFDGSSTTTTLTISGMRAGASGPTSTTGPLTTLTRVELNWTGLTSVAFSTSDDVGLDNIELSVAPVPLPAGLPLLAAGLGGLFALQRRKQARRA